jgi:hypothetical protein
VDPCGSPPVLARHPPHEISDLPANGWPTRQPSPPGEPPPVQARSPRGNQPITVSGCTMTTASDHLDHRRRSTTQNAGSAGPIRGRRFCRAVASCWRQVLTSSAACTIRSGRCCHRPGARRRACPTRSPSPISGAGSAPVPPPRQPRYHHRARAPVGDLHVGHHRRATHRSITQLARDRAGQRHPA